MPAPIFALSKSGTAPDELTTKEILEAAIQMVANSLWDEIQFKSAAASPTFTGTPTAPTAAPGTNTTQIATAAFVQAAIEALAGGAPGALDTLNELAAALGDDPNFATTMINALAGKSATGHGHGIDDTTGLQSALDAKAGLSQAAFGASNRAEAKTLAQVIGVANIMLHQQGGKVVIRRRQLAETDPLNVADEDGPATTDPWGVQSTLDGDLLRSEIDAALALKAPLASPALTGTPTAPTADLATDTTQIATTAFVQALLAAMVDSSPASLDTLNELAAALGDDPNFATTMINALAGKATAAQGDKADALRTELVLDTIDRSGKPFAIVDDATGRMAMHVDRAGHVWVGGADVSEFFRNESGLAALLSALEQAPSRSGYSLAFVDDLGRIGFGLNGAGHVIVDGTDLTALLRTDIPARFATVSAALESNTNIWCLGDSLTEGAGASAYDKTYPFILSNLLGASQTVANAGIGGQTSDQIAARSGGEAVLIDLSGGEIPENASAVVTSISNAFLTTPATTAARAVNGWLGGVYGTLSKDTSNVYSFQRAVAGDDPHPLPVEAVFELDAGALPDQTAIIWAGRNDNLNTSADAAFDSVVAMVKALRPVNNHFVILSILNASDEPSGSQDYDDIMAFNRRLKVKYPSNYLDVRALLIQAHNSGLPSDVADAANDIPPGSLRSDTVHLNDTGYALIAQAVKDFLDQKGW